ncbi:MAG: translation initiation factor IF-1 [Lentisphaeria bacterium]|nr:translation initiation factor IF-1 [Lentisphaeria bacterium]
MSNGFYKVEIEGGHEILAHAKGRMKKFNIRILAGDRVSLELSTYDPTKGRITYRNKN